ncbi:hypothetical protein J3F84DRAFT_355646 [Trichoderma pleuroticola]
MGKGWGPLHTNYSDESETFVILRLVVLLLLLGMLVGCFGLGYHTWHCVNVLLTLDSLFIAFLPLDTDGFTTWLSCSD